MNRPIKIAIHLLFVLGLTSLALTGQPHSIKAAAIDLPATTTPTFNAGNLSPDAIAIRVFDNHSQLSPRDWYNKNIGAQRSLQSLIVDGYDAVRDDRTVYVATANVELCSTGLAMQTGAPAGAICLKPIMVVISFNQNISNEAVDIFGQILNNWHFNQNINNQPGTCGVTGPSCLTNQDCANNQVCTSLKSRVIRDTKRLIDITSIKNKLEAYRTTYLHYPNLEAGTYLSNKTLSVWPSWQKTLALKLGTALPTDPINKLGSCANNFNPTTCWDEQQHSFATNWPTLPNNSRSYQYEFLNNTHYRLCTNFETNYYNVTSIDCASSHENNGPIITCSTMNGVAGQAFTGYADIYDNEGDLIDPRVTVSSPTGWGAITASLINNRQRIKLTSAHAGSNGRYDITITAQDSLGAISSKTCTIVIGGGLCGNNTINTGEDCEGNLGIAATASDSSASKQYACNQYCRFTGGYCGDNVLQNGQNFTINKEQCDGTKGIATKTSDSNSSRQYACGTGNNACQFTGGYCGDRTVQTNSNPQISEQCDRSTTSTNPTPAQTLNGVMRYQCGQPGTTNACKFAGGYCGDNIVDTGYNETCEPGTYITPPPANSSSTRQYSCTANTCQQTGGYCGNGTIQATSGENCDCGGNSKNCVWVGNPRNPVTGTTSSATNLHLCQNCQQTGGWCGDGIVQTSSSETCDPLEDLSAFRARIGNNNIDQAYFNQFISACSSSKCKMTCYDQDGDGYGLSRFAACGGNTTADCEDRPAGSDGLLGGADDGNQINPGQPDDCSQYNGIDNNCNGRRDEKGWLASPLFFDTFTGNTVGVDDPNSNGVATAAIDTTTGVNQSGGTDNRSAKIHQDANYTGWPNTCTNLQQQGACTPYDSLVALKWDIRSIGLNIGQNYVVSFSYKGSANFLHPTTATNINGQVINPFNQIAWVLSIGDLASSTSWATSSSSLIKPGSYTSFSSRAIGSFNYDQNLSQLAGTQGNLFFNIAAGRNNTDASGNDLNIDNVAIATCNNIRPDGTWCGDGQVQGSYETCDFNLVSSWNQDTEFCDDSCSRGRKLKILQVYPGSSLNSVSVNSIIAAAQDSIIGRTATVTAVSLTTFKNNYASYIPANNPTSLYNVIVFGFKDCNNSEDLISNGNLGPASSTQDFIEAGGGVIFGHDTIWKHTLTCGGDHAGFNSLAHYAGIEARNYISPDWFTSVQKNSTESPTSTMFTKPYLIPNNFTVLRTHTSGSFPSSTLCTAADGLKKWFHQTASSTDFWATTCGRVEYIVLGHTSDTEPLINEKRALMNMLYYVATREY